MSARKRTREYALDALSGVLLQGHSLDQAWTALPAAAQSDTLVRNLCYGVLRWRWRLEFWRDQLLSRPLRKRDADVSLALLLGLFQLAFLNIPAAIAINATVATIKRRKPWAAALLNACLRSFCGQLERLSEQAGHEPQARFAHPAWLLAQLRSDWPRHWQSIADGNNVQAPLWLRVNRTRTRRSDLLALLTEHGLQALGGDAPESIRLTNTGKVADLPGFADGWFSVQDQSAQWAAHLLDAQAGQRVLDACAAPGGKASHILELQGDLDLLLLERDRRRSERIRQNLSRLGLHGKVRVTDAAQPEHWWDGHGFDRILLDAPCSGTGVIRRHPDIKSLRCSEDIARHVAQQRGLLDALWPVLKPGGRLLYATCSLMAAENGIQIQQFLHRHGDGVVLGPTMNDALPSMLPGCQLGPTADGGDGFYYALLEKR